MKRPVDSSPIGLARTSDQRSMLLSGTEDLPMLDRAYRSAIVLLLESGLSGLAGVKTADIAKLASTTESTLFRHVDSREQLMRDSINWCWQVVNREIANRVFREPVPTLDPVELILRDVDVVLNMYDDSLGRLAGTGALLGYRRSDRLTGGVDVPEQAAFASRLEELCGNLIAECPTTGPGDGARIATFITNYLATIWFTWLADPNSSTHDGLLSRSVVLVGLRSQLGQLQTCQFEQATS